MGNFILSVDLAARLQELKKDDETIDGFGKAMKDWVSNGNVNNRRDICF